ncbi:MAG: hypothetical protein E5W49_12195 [Mesorhizobium sp.]|nr:MAG: hypothetical protein E5W49_12195 [Mesorhizobium sp.]
MNAGSANTVHPRQENSPNTLKRISKIVAKEAFGGFQAPTSRHGRNIFVIGNRPNANPPRDSPSDAKSSQGTPRDGHNTEKYEILEYLK